MFICAETRWLNTDAVCFICASNKWDSVRLEVMTRSIDQYNILMQQPGGFLRLDSSIAFKYPIKVTFPYE